MLAALFLSFGVQGLTILTDEFVFHHRRGLPQWERIGHPMDTLSLLVCLLWVLLQDKTEGASLVFLGLAAFSCLLITKDEAVHSRECGAAEQWLHSVLFVVHPIGLGMIYLVWGISEFRWALVGQAMMLGAFLLYQIIYWNFVREMPAVAPMKVNQKVYDELGEKWYVAQDDPIALLRAESRLRNPWLISELQARHEDRPCQILDVGCGAGLLANALASALRAPGQEVFGIDCSAESLKIAHSHDSTGRVEYRLGDALSLPFPDGTFDAVCAMDFLEHVEDPARVVAECARVLKRSGVFYFYTFNRNPLTWLVVIKGVYWFIRNTPPDLHLYRLLIKPSELHRFCHEAGLNHFYTTGVRPAIFSRTFWKMLRTGSVPGELRFEFTRSTAIAYLGRAIQDQTERVSSLRSPVDNAAPTSLLR